MWLISDGTNQMKILIVLNPEILSGIRLWLGKHFHAGSKYLRVIKESMNNKCWRGCGEKGTLLHCWWECKLIQPLWRTVWRCLIKLKIELPYDPAIPLLGIYPEKNMVWKDTWTPMFTAALFTIASKWTYLQNRNRLRERNYGYQVGRVEGRDSWGVWG